MHEINNFYIILVLALILRHGEHPN